MSREKECKCCHEWWYASVIKEDLCPNCYDYFKQLKQQLAEKDTRIEELEGQFAYECECNKQLVELQKQLAEKDKTIAKLEEDNGYILFEDGYDENGKEVHRQVYKTYKQAFNEQVLETKKLRRQLREKDEELEELKSQQTHTQQVCDKYHSLYEEKFNRVLELVQEKHELEQTQTKLAIQELKKVKVKLRAKLHLLECGYLRHFVAWQDICDQINNQIKELKGE